MYWSISSGMFGEIGEREATAVDLLRTGKAVGDPRQVVPPLGLVIGRVVALELSAGVAPIETPSALRALTHAVRDMPACFSFEQEAVGGVEDPLDVGPVLLFVEPRQLGQPVVQAAGLRDAVGVSLGEFLQLAAGQGRGHGVHPQLQAQPGAAVLGILAPGGEGGGALVMPQRGPRS